MSKNKPMQYASGYVLDIYCRNSGYGVHEHDRISAWTQYGGESFADCARQAKAEGWKLRRSDRTATCPHCAQRGD